MNIAEAESKVEQSNTKPERLESLLVLVGLIIHSETDRSLSLCRDALSLAEELDSNRQIARAKKNIGFIRWNKAEYDLALTSYKEALELYSVLEDDFRAAQCYRSMGFISAIVEQHQEALDFFKRAVKLAETAKKPGLVNSVSNNVGHLYFTMGRYSDAAGTFKKALEYACKFNDEMEEAIATSGLAGVYLYNGEPQKAIRWINRSILIHEKLNQKDGVAMGMMNRAIAVRKTGSAEDAKKEFLMALEYANSISVKTTELGILNQLIELSDLLGETSDVRRFNELKLNLQADEVKLHTRTKLRK